MCQVEIIVNVMNINSEKTKKKAFVFTFFRSNLFTCRIWKAQKGDSLEKRIRYLTLVFLPSQKGTLVFVSQFIQIWNLFRFTGLKCMKWEEATTQRGTFLVCWRKLKGPFCVKEIWIYHKFYCSVRKVFRVPWQFNHSDRMECDFEKFPFLFFVFASSRSASVAQLYLTMSLLFVCDFPPVNLKIERHNQQ